MKLKYYLRGLGIGIVVTALLMGYSGNKPEDVKAQEEKMQTIKEMQQSQEAEALTAEALTEVVTTEEDASEEASEMQTLTEEAPPETTEITTETIPPETEDSKEETESEPVSEETLPEAAQEETQEPHGENEQTAGKTATISVVRGDDSGTVSRKLQNAGMIDNAGEFDAFLMQHGYDKKISVGTFQIEEGSTWIQIAEKLAGRN